MSFVDELECIEYCTLFDFDDYDGCKVDTLKSSAGNRPSTRWSGAKQKKYHLALVRKLQTDLVQSY